MSRSLRGFCVGSFLLVLAGCGREGDPKAAPAVAPGVAVAPPGGPAVPPPEKIQGVVADFQPPPLLATTVDPNTEKYDAAIADALNLLGEQKYPEALQAFETARGLNDNEFVRGEIDKLKTRLDQDLAATKTVAEIRTVIADGKSQEASQLVTKALAEFGDRDVAPKLLDLRVQADALRTVDLREDDAARFERLRGEGQAAAAEKNLRAAGIAFEQALAIRQDAALAAQYADIHDKLDKYDGLRKQAAELRRDSARLEEAVALLRDAAKAWDTLQVRQDIDEYNLALERRRDTLSVADFEVGGDLGFGDAGRVLAEELLPYFKPRFDLVERAQIARVAQELNVDTTYQTDAAQQREVGSLAKVRYLVLGSVRRLGQVIVQARLVDANTGLIVQTGRLSGDRIEDLVPRMPELARQLMMSDDEKLAYDQQVAAKAPPITPVAENTPLPPPPPPDQAPPAPLMIDAPPPPLGTLNDQQFQGLPPPPPVLPVGAVVVGEAPPLMQQRMLYATLTLGDNLVRAGQFGAAQQQFDFALTLAPGNFDIRLRLDRVRPLLPPPPVLLVVEQPVIVVRPRLAMLNFLVVGDPRVVPPGLSLWTPMGLAPYFRANYDIVDPAEVYWMMGQMGLSVSDVMNDPIARRWLGRALRVQAFVVGAVEQTASFNVSTYLLNAEHGYLQGSARVHVRNPFELKLRLGEIASLTMMPPQQRAVYVAQQNQFDVFLTRGREGMGRRDFALSISVYEDALRLRPGNLEVMLYLNQARAARRQWELEELRRQEYRRQVELAEMARRRQWELAREAEAARVRAAQLAAADRERIERQRALAYGDMVNRARVAVQVGNFTLAVNLFKGALDVAPPQGVVAVPVPHDTVLAELARARAETERARKDTAVAEAVAARETAIRQERERELAKAREKLAVEEAKLKATQIALKQANDAKFAEIYGQGEKLMAQGKYDAAIVTFQSAKQIKKTPGVDAMLAMALERQAQQSVKTAAEKLAIEQKIADSNKKAREAEALAKRNHGLYDEALKQANAALVAKRYDEAEKHYSTASQFFKTDAALTGMKQAVAARAAEQKAAQAKADSAQRVAALLSAGKASFDAGRFPDAVVKLQEARKLEPTNVEVLAALTRAEQARDRAQAAAVQSAKVGPSTPIPVVSPPVTKGEEPRQAEFKKLLGEGQLALKSQRYDLAIKSLTAAQKLMPQDPTVATLLAEARSGQASFDRKTTAQSQSAKVQTALAAGRAALKSNDFATAAKEFAAAKALAPTDPQVVQAERDLATARQAFDQQKSVVAFTAAFDKGKKALDAKNYTVAIQSLKEAVALQPMNAQAAQLLQQATLAHEASLKSDTAYTQSLQQAQQALIGKNYPVAVQAAQEALKHRPNDPQAMQILQQASTSLNAAKTAEANAMKLKQLVDEGQRLLVQKKYAEALGPLQEASRLAPSDPMIAGLVRQAQTGAAEQNADQKKRAIYNDALQTGQRLLQQKRYAEALQALQGARSLYPTDPQVNALIQQANQGLTTPMPKVETPKVELPKVTPPMPKEDPNKKAAEIQKRLADGQNHLQARRFADAIREFEAVLAIDPGNAPARALLQRAKMSK
jgi:tetratricopeptide (TPR) repeat protein